MKFASNKYFQGDVLFLIRDIAKREKSEVMDDFNRNIQEKLLKNGELEGKTF